VINAVIAIVVVATVTAGLTLMVMAYFRTQRHKLDAAALRDYRALAEQVAAQQQGVTDRLDEIGRRLAAVEQLLRSVE